MHKLLVLANALVGQNRPGRPDTGAQRRGSGREVRRPPPRELSRSTPARAMLEISSTTTGLHGTGGHHRAPDTGH